MLHYEINGWKSTRTPRERQICVFLLSGALAGGSAKRLSQCLFLDTLTSKRKLSSECVHTGDMGE